MKPINNLTIKHAGLFEPYQVITPNGVVTEEFTRWEEVVAFCRKPYNQSPIKVGAPQECGCEIHQDRHGRLSIAYCKTHEGV